MKQNTLLTADKAALQKVLKLVDATHTSVSRVPWHDKATADSFENWLIEGEPSHLRWTPMFELALHDAQGIEKQINSILRKKDGKHESKLTKCICAYVHVYLKHIM
jgi:hypothetical protein